MWMGAWMSVWMRHMCIHDLDMCVLIQAADYVLIYLLFGGIDE